MVYQARMRSGTTLHRPPLLRPWSAVGTLALLVGLSTSGWAQTTSTSTQTVDRRMHFEVQQYEVATLLALIAKTGGFPIAISSGVTGRVDLNVQDVSPQVALKLLLNLANLEAHYVHDVLVVSPGPGGAKTGSLRGPAPKVAKPAAPAKKPVIEDLYRTPKDTLKGVLAGKDLTGTPSVPPRQDELPRLSAKTDETRPLPDYDGRPAAPATAGEILVQIPRLIFLPVRVVMNYLLRAPVIWGITRLEEVHAFKRIDRFFSFRDGKSKFFPTFLADFGLRPAAGIAVSNEDLFFRGNDLTLGATYGGNSFFAAHIMNQTTVLSDDSGRLRLFGNFETRTDQPFYGAGPISSTDTRYNYKARRIEAGWDLRAVVADLSWVTFGQTLRDRSFSNNGINDNLALLEAAPSNCGSEGYRSGGLASNGRPYAPCGYVDGEGYQLLESRIEAKIDTRDPDTEYRAGTGLLFEAFGSFNFDPSNVSRSFVRFGGEAAGFWDVSGAGHVLALRLYSEFTEGTGSENDPIPFTELTALGGLETMRGFLNRRFVGDSAFSATASYRYPIWSMLDAELFASVGNVFDGYYSGWALKRQSLSSGISLRTTLTREASLQMLFAVGTNRFEEASDDNFKVDSIRFAFGYVQGF